MKFNWGWRIAIVYTVFAVSTIGFVTFAMSQKVQLVRTDYYEHSLDHDKTRAAEARGESAAERLTIELGTTDLKVMLPADHHGAKGKVLLYRPDNSGLDKTFDISDQGIAIPIDALIPGHYTVVLEWEHARDAYKVERNIEISARS